MSRLRRTLRLCALGFTAILPSLIKRLFYRYIFGYRVASDVTIGFTLLDAEKVTLGPGSSIGHFNVVTRVAQFSMGQRARLGWCNLIRGGDEVQLGPFSTVLRLNVINAIPDHDCEGTPQSRFELAAGAFVAAEHRIDFTDQVRVGRNSIIGGRNSSLWTHNRQQTAPILIGDFCYVGSEVRIAPGAALAAECILGLGAVLTDPVATPRQLVVGVPARPIRALTERDLALVRRKTRREIPDDLYGPAPDPV